MLSRNPHQQKSSTMYGQLLHPFVQVQSMKGPNRNASLRCEESCEVYTRRGCSDLTRTNIRRSRAQTTDGSDRRTNGTGSEQICHNLIMPGRRTLSWKNPNRLWNGIGSSVFFIVSLLSVLATCQADSDSCAPGLKTPGRTWPPGDIVLEEGEPLTIYCILDQTSVDPKFEGKNASDLVFFRNVKKMEPEFTTIINSTTIALTVLKPPPSADWYYCKVRLDEDYDSKFDVVCHNKVIVGFKPIEPNNFTCVSRNWESLTCSWEPVHNDVATNFTLRFNFAGRAGGRAIWSCPLPREDQPPNTCTLDSTTNPIYRQSQPNYSFTLNASNVFGHKLFKYPFNHYAHVIPSQPARLSVVNKTYSSALLYWEVPYPMESFPPGLHSKVSYQSIRDPQKTWEKIDITDDPHAPERYFNLTHLQYANAVYDIRVYLKSAWATDDNHWSAFSYINVKTAATLPGRSPKTDIGSFQVEGNMSRRDIYIYWQTIPAYLENGDNFTYQVVSVEENGKTLDVQPSEKTKSYAKFKGMSHEHLKFVVVTTNVIGANETKAVIHVPSHSEMVPEPVAFTKIAFDNGIHELSWTPSNNLEITNYTIFWCENAHDRPYQCKGYLDWVHVSWNTSAYNITVPDTQKNYQFAIAANTERASSGMAWAACTAIHNGFVGKINSRSISGITSDTLNVTWKLECSDRIDSIKGYVLYYCPIVKPENGSCKTPEKKQFVHGGPQISEGQLVGLKPYTTYSIKIAVMTKNGEGPQNDPLHHTTYEGAPTPPRDVRIRNVTNTSMVVEWEPPEAENGKIVYYMLYYGNKYTRVEQTSEHKNRSVWIQGLQPYKNYTVTVSAHTVKEGNHSEPRTQATAIGLPGKIEVPKVHFSNATQVQIQWDPPKEAGGKLDYYEIKTDETIYTNITTNEKYLGISRCEEIGRKTPYSFQVRAVNLGPKKESFKGPWSDPGEVNCFNIGPSNTVWVIIWIIGCLSGVAFVMFLGYSSKRLWIKCKAMQDVEVKLPPGLQPNSKLLEKGNEQHSQQLSADSSGCSSGQESVTSSLTDSHVSTDSGADLDPVPMSPTKLLEPPPTWESSSNLRQRNVTGTTKPDFSGERGRWDPYVKVAKTVDTPTGDSLSLARSTPNLTADETVAMAAVRTCPTSQPHNWSSTGYISMPSSEEDSSNNPSPLPCDKGSSQGVYSVVGLAPSPTPLKRVMERSQPRTGDLIPIGGEARKEPIAPSPYVSLASLEQKSRNTNNPRIQSIGDFVDLGFVQSVREEQPRRQQQEPQQPPPPYSISDKISKPYVQAGLMNTMKICGRTPEISGGRPPFAPNFGDPSSTLSHSLIEIPSNPYMPVDTAHGPPVVGINKDSAQVENPYVAVSTLAASSESPSLKNRQSAVRTDDHLASPYSFSSQQTAQKKSADRDETVDRSAAASLPVVKQTYGYVTIAENPTSSSTPYVPHQQVDKKSLPSYQQSDGPVDEQYSKVTAVPTTT